MYVKSYFYTIIWNINYWSKASVSNLEYKKKIYDIIEKQ